jgi:hypothetical protein
MVPQRSLEQNLEVSVWTEALSGRTCVTLVNAFMELVVYNCGQSK